METLQEAKQRLRSNFHKGTDCPCCGQFVKLYKRKLTSSMAYGLLLLKDKTEWTHVENYFKTLDIPSSIRGDISKLVYWKMLERQEGKREDGSNRIGYYRITQLGINFVNNMQDVPSHVLIYNNKFQGYSDTRTNIVKFLGNKFNYSELMK